MKFDHYLYENIGEQLRAAREKKQLSLQQVADRIDGYKSKQTIMRYENGSIRIDEVAFEKICSVLGLDADQVVANAKLAQATDRHLENIKTINFYNSLRNLLRKYDYNISQFDTVFSYLHLPEEDQAVVDMLVKTLSEKNLHNKFNEAMNDQEDPFFASYKEDREE